MGTVGCTRVVEGEGSPSCSGPGRVPIDERLTIGMPAHGEGPARVVLARERARLMESVESADLGAAPI
jgi:hypothetical protein